MISSQVDVVLLRADEKRTDLKPAFPDKKEGILKPEIQFESDQKVLARYIKKKFLVRISYYLK